MGDDVIVGDCGGVLAGCGVLSVGGKKWWPHLAVNKQNLRENYAKWVGHILQTHLLRRCTFDCPKVMAAGPVVYGFYGFN